MRLEGLHHITAITGNAPRNVDFYVRVLGLRLVKRSVNQDDPTVYHLFYADEVGSAGADLTFFEYPNARPGKAGAGMVHRIAHRVASVGFWADRLGSEGVATTLVDGALRFSDPDGLEHELVEADVPDEPLRARSTEVPDEHALQGFDAVYAAVPSVARSAALLTDTMGAVAAGPSSFEVRGSRRGSLIHFSEGGGRGTGGAGTVHHIAWAAPMDDHTVWRERIAGAGRSITPVIDRSYFRSVYFREPGGILFEIATIGPGFTTDEPAASLGESLALPPAVEHVRAQVEPLLTPLPDIRRWRPPPAG